MRLFGIQIGLTVLVVLLYRKLGKSYSFAHWLLTNGQLYLYYPSLLSILELNTEQKSVAKKTNKPPNESISSKLDFTVESIREVKMCREKLSLAFLENAEFFADFNTQIDACFLTVLVALLTQLLFYISPYTEETQLNLALFWLIGLFLNLTYHSVKHLLIYFSKILSHEWSLCILFGLLYFLITFIFITTTSIRQELNLDDLEISFFALLRDYNVTNNATELKVNYGLYIRFAISLYAAFVGMLFVFPSNRIAKCHTRCIQMCNRNFLGYLSYQLLFWLPIFPCIFWIPVMGREMLAEGSHAIIDINTFMFLRNISIPLVICARIISCRPYIQAFLERPNDILRTLQSKYSRINGILLYSTLILPNSYIGVVALHCTLLPCYLLCFTLSAWFLSAFSTATYTFLFHTCVFNAWWCCVTSTLSGLVALLYQNYIESDD